MATGSAVTIVVSKRQQEDITILSQEGSWTCNVQLGAPEGYDGSMIHVRIVLVQGDFTTELFEGYTVFPYFLNAEGIAGEDTGTVFVYSLDDDGQVTGSVAYEVPFTNTNG